MAIEMAIGAMEAFSQSIDDYSKIYNGTGSVIIGIIKDNEGQTVVTNKMGSSIKVRCSKHLASDDDSWHTLIAQGSNTWKRPKGYDFHLDVTTNTYNYVVNLKKSVNDKTYIGIRDNLNIDYSAPDSFWNVSVSNIVPIDPNQMAVTVAFTVDTSAVYKILFNDTPPQRLMTLQYKATSTGLYKPKDFFDFSTGNSFVSNLGLVYDNTVSCSFIYSTTDVHPILTQHNLQKLTGNNSISLTTPITGSNQLSLSEGVLYNIDLNITGGYFDVPYTAIVTYPDQRIIHDSGILHAYFYLNIMWGTF